MARPQKCRCICSIPKNTCFYPENHDDTGVVTLGFDEYETVRLIDYEKFSQFQCAGRMQVSRATVARMYENARQKLADALVNGKKIVISGGDIAICTEIKPECKNMAHCCHRINQKKIK